MNFTIQRPPLSSTPPFMLLGQGRRLAALVWLSSALALPATVLDDFTGVKTGWTDTLNGGAIAQAGGQFTITTAAAAGALAYSRKSSTDFTNVSGHTLEFRVDVNGVTPGNPDPNPETILAWVPANGALLGSGYSLLVGAKSVSVQKAASVLYTMNYGAAGTNIQNTNLTLVLRMSASGGAVTLNVRVCRRISNGLIAQYFTTLFERTIVDSFGLVGAAGNVALGVKNLASSTGASAGFANLQVFDITSTVLDNFDTDNGLAGWSVFKKNPGLGDAVNEGSGVLDVTATIADASGGFAGVYSTKTYKIIDGGRVEFQLDVVGNPGGNGSYSALGYLPVGSPEYIYGIVEYHIANDVTGHTLVVNGKGYNEWWGGRNDIQPPWSAPGSRYTLAMTGEGSNCRVESRIEDLSVTDPNDPARIVWQTEFVDTPAADPGLNESSLGNPQPYLNFDGHFCISVFNSGALPPLWAEALFDNAVVGQTLPPLAAPGIANVFPAFGANFLASSNVVSFDATDATNVPLDQMFVTLNGVQYGSGSPGVTITPGGAMATSRHFVLTGALNPNVNYTGAVRVTGPSGLASVATLAFDTFLTNDYVIESEDYNFSPDGGLTGGSSIDQPALVAEGISAPNAYYAQNGLPEVDFHDNRGTCFLCGAFGDANHTWRPGDVVYTSHSGDQARSKYTNAGGASANFYEQEVTDIFDGDWLNYTHAYPAGTYSMVLRQAQFQIPQSLVTLERVTSDRTQPNQTTAVLGAFMGTPTGLGLFKNVPLTDGTGKPLVVRFSGGVDTLRVMNRITGNANLDVGNLEQNYIALVPAADPGTLRPMVSLVSPLPNATLNSAFPLITASIINRDTSLAPGTVALDVNGSPAAATVTATPTGANVSFAMTTLPPPNSTVTSTLIFADTTGAYQTNTWTWVLSYVYLRASNSLPPGSLGVRGFDVRTVQADNGGVNLDNTLVRARQQLAIPPEIPYDRSATGIVQVLNWNQSGTPNPVPGLCPAGEIKNIAVESLAYLELTPGVHRFHVNTDDQAGFYSGARLEDPSGLTLWEAPGNTANATFDFVVEAAGLYPFRAIWEQTGGGAVLSVTSVSLNDNSELQLNDPSDAPGVVKAWYPLVCESSASVSGPFTADATAVNAVNLADVVCSDTAQVLNQRITGGTLTIPQSGAVRFYRVDGPRPTRITSITRTGSNIVLTYTVN